MARVTTVIPVYNGERSICAAVDSVLNQDWDGNELIVVDDGSTDGTRAVLAAYGSRIKVVARNNMGAAAARNAGVRAGDSEFIAFLDSDDEWMPGRLAKTFAALQKRPSAIMAFSDLLSRDEMGRTFKVTTGPAPSMDQLLSSIPRIQPGTWLVRRHAFERCGGFIEQFSGCGGEDLFMLLRLREEGEFAYVDEPLLRYSRSSWASIGAKYELGRSLQLALLRSRYGRRSRALRRDISNSYASSFLQRALEQIDSGDRAGAIESLWKSFRARPRHLAESGALSHLLRRSNFRRLCRFITGPVQ